jgi:hypothetical protein
LWSRCNIPGSIPLPRCAKQDSPEVADEALRVLPDPVDEDQIVVFLAPHAITMDELASRTGAEM